MKFFDKFFRKKKPIVVIAEQAPEIEEPILTDEEKEAERKRKVNQLFDSIENDYTVRINIDGRSMLYTKRKNEQNNT